MRYCYLVLLLIPCEVYSKPAQVFGFGRPPTEMEVRNVLGTNLKRNTGFSPTDLQVSRPIAGCFERGFMRRDICGYKVCVSYTLPNLGMRRELVWLTNGFSQISFPNAAECRGTIENWFGSPPVELPRFCDYQRGHPDCAGSGRTEVYSDEPPVTVQDNVNPAAASIHDAPFQSGDLQNWTVTKTLDPMTDDHVCAGSIKGREDLELSGDTLYVKVKGGLEAITLRFDSDVALPQRSATDLEKRIGAFAIQAPDFTRALSAARLRYRALTLVRSLEDGDVDIREIAAARDAITHCSEFTGGTVASKCDDQMRASLREKGLSSTDITEVCGR